jgi:hypothetical protein
VHLPVADHIFVELHRCACSQLRPGSEGKRLAAMRSAS